MLPGSRRARHTPTDRSWARREQVGESGGLPAGERPGEHPRGLSGADNCERGQFDTTTEARAERSNVHDGAETGEPAAAVVDQPVTAKRAMNPAIIMCAMEIPPVPSTSAWTAPVASHAPGTSAAGARSRASQNTLTVLWDSRQRWCPFPSRRSGQRWPGRRTFLSRSDLRAPRGYRVHGPRGRPAVFPHR